MNKDDQHPAEEKGVNPTPIAPLSEQPKVKGTDMMDYYAYSPADRLTYVRERIEEREKVYFNLHLISVSLTGNPENGEHIERVEVTDDKPPQPPCICRDCELTRVDKLLISMGYAINQLKAVHASLA